MDRVVFDLSDYLRMFRKYGLRLPFNYFINAHLFDLIHRTDTHTWLPKHCYTETPLNFDSGVLYMSSWTSEIVRSFTVLERRHVLSKPYVFIDVGCGKGKACLTWAMRRKNSHNRPIRIVGIDYYKPLVDVAKRNFKKVFNTEGEFYVANAENFDFRRFNALLVVYLYNPFDRPIIERLLEKLPLGTVVIYNNPVHGEAFLKYGFTLLHETHGWHPNVCSMIFKKCAY
jgi:SAM-dependent methyltransferase